MKVIIASDSFKGSLTSAEVARAASAGVHDILPDATVVPLAVADGGEGTAEAVTRALGGATIPCRAHDPLGRVTDASYGMVRISGIPTAIIDMASASGLTLLSEGERNPLVTSSRGTGELIINARDHGCRRFVIGIGGSATSDGGKGMLEALGFRFLDSRGRQLAPGGGSLADLAAIDATRAMTGITAMPFTIICDVTSPLYGPEGAARMFAPQKGASSADVELLDAGLRQLASIVRRATGHDVALRPGAGAAGGLGAAFMAFFNSTITPGVDTVLDLIGFDRHLAGADLIITGEGRIDSQTLYGKLPMGVLKRGTAAGVPVAAICGGCAAEISVLLEAGFAGIFPILNRPLTMSEAMRPDIASANVRATCASIISLVIHSRTTRDLT